MDHVSSLIPSFLKKRGLYDEAHASMMVFRATKWYVEYHPHLASFLHPKTFKDGILTLIAQNEASLQEAALLSDALRAFLQSEGKYMVKEIQVLAA